MSLTKYEQFKAKSKRYALTISCDEEYTTFEIITDCLEYMPPSFVKALIASKEYIPCSIRPEIASEVTYKYLGYRDSVYILPIKVLNSRAVFEVEWLISVLKENGYEEDDTLLLSEITKDIETSNDIKQETSYEQVKRLLSNLYQSFKRAQTPKIDVEDYPTVMGLIIVAGVLFAIFVILSLALLKIFGVLLILGLPLLIMLIFLMDSD